MRPRLGMLAALASAALALPVAAKDGRKIYVSVDMEGVAGVVSAEQLGPAGFEYARFREFMMQGLDESFDGVIFIGYHTGTTNPEGVRAHTMSSATLADVRLNGVSVPEAAFNAAIAGHYGVPVLAISGDDAIVKEARGLLGDVEGAVVKWAYGFHSAKTLTPEAARDVIREKVKAAMLTYQPSLEP